MPYLPATNEEKRARWEDMQRRRSEGQSLREVGNAWGISATRVQQILAREPVWYIDPYRELGSHGMTILLERRLHGIAKERGICRADEPLRESHLAHLASLDDADLMGYRPYARVYLGPTLLAQFRKHYPRGA